MLTLAHGVPWIHTAPAILAVIFGFLYVKTKWIYLKGICGILWLLLIPNTAYIFIDITRIMLHWHSVTTGTRAIIILQYIVLEMIGLVTFLLAMFPFESVIHTKYFPQKTQVLTILLFNLLIGFGMVLGRTGYTNSYVVFTQPTKVFLAAMTIMTSSNLLVLTIAFGALCNCIYFLFRNRLLYYAEKQKLL